MALNLMADVLIRKGENTETEEGHVKTKQRLELRSHKPGTTRATRS